MLLCFTALFLQGCKDSDNAAMNWFEVLSDGNAVEQLDFHVASSYKMLGINTDVDWTASVPESDASWLTITPHEGFGYSDSLKNSYIKVSVEANEGEERQSAITIIAGGITKVIKVSQKGAGTDGSDPFESAFSFVRNLKLGYNLGNTLDANPDINESWFNPTSVSDWETAWGQPTTTQEIIDAIAAKGFNVIRVPVTWYPHMDEEDNVEAAWMNRVQEVVDMVLKAGCYCILNVQHDNGAKDPARKDGAGWLYADESDYPTITKRYQKLWQQIATQFKDYDEKLIFESFNEILNKSYSWTPPAAGDGAYTAINKLQQDFVNVVRATGGNNEYRNLALTTYSAGSSQTALDAFLLPEDSHQNHLYASIHTYDPYNFCNNNAGKNADGSEYDYNIKVFNDDCRTEISNVVSRVAKRFNNVGIPYVFGEFGAIDEKKEMAERIKYATYITQQFKANNTTGLWWMGLIDRKTLNWYESEIVDALFQGIQ